MKNKKRFALILVIVLMISLFATVLVACNGKSDGTNDQPSISTDKSKSGDKDNQKQQEDKKPEEEKEPTKPTIKPTVVQRKVDLSTYQLNIPANAASLGIVTDTGAKASASDEEYAAVSSYLSAFDEYNRLLSGVGNEITFSKARKAYYVHVLEDVYTVDVYEGEDVYEMEEVEDPDSGEMVEQPVIDGETGLPVVIGRQLKLDEDGNPIFIETIEIIVDHGETVSLEDEYVEDADGNFQTNLVLVENGRNRRDDGGKYVYAIDPDTGSRIVAKDKNGVYLWADDNTDEDEELADVQDECGQAEFGMDLIKLKIVNNYAFMCFALPVPEICYTAINGTVFYIQLADGTMQPFTNADLPMRRSSITSLDDYDSISYFTNVFCQSYVIDTNTGKIYSLNGVNISSIEKGYVVISNKKMDMRILNGSDKLQFLDISNWLNDPEVIDVRRDNNGIIYIGYEERSSIDFNMIANGTIPCVEYRNKYDSSAFSAAKISRIGFDKSSNAYMFVDGKLKRIVGYIVNEIDGSAQFKYSEINYGESDTEAVYFDSGNHWWFAKDGYFYTKSNGVSYVSNNNDYYIDRFDIGYHYYPISQIDYNKTQEYFLGATAYTLTDGVLSGDVRLTEFGFMFCDFYSGLRLVMVIAPIFRDSIPEWMKQQQTYHDYGTYIRYDVPILYEGESINSSSKCVSVEKPPFRDSINQFADENGYIIITYNMGKNKNTGDINYVVVQIDAQLKNLNEIPEHIDAVPVDQYKGEREKLPDYIIVIAPLN